MLPAHIIERIREREARRYEEQRPQPTVEIPQPPMTKPAPDDSEKDRGVVIIEL